MAKAINKGRKKERKPTSGTDVTWILPKLLPYLHSHIHLCAPYANRPQVVKACWSSPAFLYSFCCGIIQLYTLVLNIITLYETAKYDIILFYCLGQRKFVFVYICGYKWSPEIHICLTMNNTT